MRPPGPEEEVSPKGRVQGVEVNEDAWHRPKAELSRLQEGHRNQEKVYQAVQQSQCLVPVTKKPQSLTFII